MAIKNPAPLSSAGFLRFVSVFCDARLARTSGGNKKYEYEANEQTAHARYLAVQREAGDAAGCEVVGALRHGSTVSPPRKRCQHSFWL
jgi:hypothetical protein